MDALPCTSLPCHAPLRPAAHVLFLPCLTSPCLALSCAALALLAPSRPAMHSLPCLPLLTLLCPDFAPSSRYPNWVSPLRPAVPYLATPFPAQPCLALPCSLFDLPFPFSPCPALHYLPCLAPPYPEPTRPAWIFLLVLPCPAPPTLSFAALPYLTGPRTALPCAEMLLQHCNITYSLNAQIFVRLSKLKHETYDTA